MEKLLNVPKKARNCNAWIKRKDTRMIDPLKVGEREIVPRTNVSLAM